MAPSTNTDKSVHDENFDPEDFRMSLGDHLEDLRSRLFKGIYFFVAAACVCMFFGDRVVAFFCKPLQDGLRREHLPDQLVTTGVTDGFSVYMNVSLIVAGAISAPFILYQLWQFIAAGLYPKERKYVTKYMPFSMGLLITGMVFLYTIVLPITVTFLIHFTAHIKPVEFLSTPTTHPTADQIMIIPRLHGDPVKPQELQIWYDDFNDKLKLCIGGQIRSMQFGSNNLLTPMIDLRDYINLVLVLLVLFGLSFQLPLVVMAVARMGLVEIDTLKRSRRVVILLLAVLSAVIVPDVVTGMLALMVPLVFLYELGIYLAQRGIRKAKEAEEAEEARERAEEEEQRRQRAAARAAQAVPATPAAPVQAQPSEPAPPAEPPAPTSPSETAQSGEPPKQEGEPPKPDDEPPKPADSGDEGPKPK